jgi:transcriptional regulator with XRE-family HTH domain
MKKEIILLPKYKTLMSIVGENIKLARKRRKLTTEQVAERANISRPTLTAIEQGKPTVSIGNYFNVLNILGLQNDFLKLAGDDILGRKLQDIELLSTPEQKRNDVDCYKTKLRQKLYLSTKRKHYGNSGLEKIIGLDYQGLEDFLNNNKYGFLIGETYIDIDHIIPLNIALNKSKVKELFHYTNLQLLPSIYNRDVKKARKWCQVSFDKWFDNY